MSESGVFAEAAAFTVSVAEPTSTAVWPPTVLIVVKLWVPITSPERPPEKFTAVSAVCDSMLLTEYGELVIRCLGVNVSKEPPPDCRMAISIKRSEPGNTGPKSSRTEKTPLLTFTELKPTVEPTCEPPTDASNNVNSKSWFPFAAIEPV